MTDGSAPQGLRRDAMVLADRRVRLATAGALTARLAQTTLPLALLLAAQARFDGFSAAGLVVSAYALGGAAGAPLLGRLADRRGRHVLPLAASLSSTALVVTANVRSPAAMLIAAALTGLCTPRSAPRCARSWSARCPAPCMLPRSPWTPSPPKCCSSSVPPPPDSRSPWPRPRSRCTVAPL